MSRNVHINTLHAHLGAPRQAVVPQLQARLQLQSSNGQTSQTRGTIYIKARLVILRDDAAAAADLQADPHGRQRARRLRLLRSQDKQGSGRKLMTKHCRSPFKIKTATQELPRVQCESGSRDLKEESDFCSSTAKIQTCRIAALGRAGT